MVGPLPLSDVCPGHQFGMDLFAVEATVLIFFQFISAFAIDRPLSADGRSCEFAGLHPAKVSFSGFHPKDFQKKNENPRVHPWEE